MLCTPLTEECGLADEVGLEEAWEEASLPSFSSSVRQDLPGQGARGHHLENLSPKERFKVYRKCKRSLLYFLKKVLHIKVRADDSADDDSDRGGDWEPFDPWPAQIKVVKAWRSTKRLLLLKARQLGMTWLILGIYVWKLLFREGSEIGVTSRRMDEAKELLKRVKEMVAHLPTWLRPKKELVKEDSKTSWELGNGSRIIAFPTTAGDSYTFSDVLIDEADKCPLGNMLSSLKPTVDGGGAITVLSKAYKEIPGTVFKHMCRKAVAGLSAWTFVFLPWYARPERDADFYRAQKAESLDIDGTLDYLHGNYPATASEALSAGTANKRIPFDWLDAASDLDRAHIPHDDLPLGAPAIPEMRVYVLPVPGRSYCLGSDVAKGLPTGDDSTISVVDQETGQECLALNAKLGNRDALPDAIEAIARWYNDAPVLVERNSIGEGTIAVLEMRGNVQLANGPDGEVGYYKTTDTRTKLWDEVVAEIKALGKARKAVLDMPDDGDRPPMPAPMVHDPLTSQQLASLDRNTCKAPKGQQDDLSDGWGLAQWLRLSVLASWAEWQW